MGMALAANATDYTDDLAVTVNGSTTTAETTISITQAEDGTYTFTLPNFSVTITMVVQITENVGTVVISGIEGTELAGGKVMLTADKNIEISAGDDESITDWIGPSLGEVPVTLSAVMTEDKLCADLGISIAVSSSLSISATAEFGTAFSDEYTGTVVATLLETPVTDTASLYLNTAADGTYSVSLDNFSISAGGDAIYVGNINVQDIEGTVNEDGSVTLSAETTVELTAGDDTSVTWVGPNLGENGDGVVPVTLSGTLDDSDLSLSLSIVSGTMFGTIGVEFTTDEESGIQSVSAATAKDGAAYTIGGVKAPASYKGIVIQNGRKVIAK